MKEYYFERINYQGEQEKHRIMYIEYIDKKVHSVITAPESKWLHFWYFETDCNDNKQYMFYNSGKGGNIKKIHAPHFVKKGSGLIWIHKEASFTGTPKNAVILKKPIATLRSLNPFRHGREVWSLDYCKICEKFYDEDWCQDHHIEIDGMAGYEDGTTN